MSGKLSLQGKNWCAPQHIPNSQMVSVTQLRWQCSKIPKTDVKWGRKHELLSVKLLLPLWDADQAEENQLSLHSYGLAAVWPFGDTPGRMSTVMSTNSLKRWPRRCAKEMVWTDLRLGWIFRRFSNDKCMFWYDWNEGKDVFGLGAKRLMISFSKVGGLPEQCGTQFLPHCTFQLL